MPDGAYFSVPVSALAERGVFVGTECEEGFCPGEAIDRKTMAVWTVRLLDGEDPPAVSGTRFDDVDPEGFHAEFIERLAELGVTRGCGDGSRFCPDRNVTRAEMAVFLSPRLQAARRDRTRTSQTFPTTAWYAAEVAKLAASKITVGCGDGSRFCPGRHTTRAEMATFLYRAENRPETDGSEDSDDESSEDDGSGGSGGGGGGGGGGGRTGGGNNRRPKHRRTQTPATQTPATQTPATQTPATQTPATQTPATQTPATQTPATQTPATQTPATQTPATQTPATQTPATQTPATQTPATQTPATQHRRLRPLTNRRASSPACRSACSSATCTPG